MSEELSEYPCQNCGKMNACRNYCDWNCHFECAKKDGGQAHLPNGLPVGCIKADGSMWEHEHGDHPDYKFPVEADFVGPITDGDISDYEMICGEKAPDEDAIRKSKGETHALIYSDYSIAITMYEHCYAMWYLRSNQIAGGNLWTRGEWKLTQASIDKILLMKRTA